MQQWSDILTEISQIAEKKWFTVNATKIHVLH